MSESSGNGGGGNGSGQACASCKYQRRKCHKDCVLAPYFPANRKEDFQNCHKLFGVSNIVKILATVEDDKKAITAETIIMEAKARKEDPVHGCVSTIRKILAMIEASSRELALVNQKLVYFRQQDHQKQLQLQRLLASRVPSSSSSFQLIQQFGLHNYHLPPPINLSHEVLNYLCGMNNLDAGFTCYPPLHEYEDFKPLDIKPINQMTSTFRQNTEAIVLKESEETSAESSSIGKTSVDRTSDKGLRNNVGASALSNVICKKEKQSMGDPDVE